MGRAIPVSFEQLPNATFPIEVSVDGNESAPVHEEHDSKALFPIWVSTGGKHEGGNAVHEGEGAILDFVDR